MNKNKEPMSKEDKQFMVVMCGIILPILLIACVLLGTFTYRWVRTYEEYDDVDFEWDDDKDRYDIYIEELGHFYMPTNKATLVFLPDDYTINYAVIEKEETIIGTLTQYNLVRFYLNVGWRGDLD